MKKHLRFLLAFLALFIGSGIANAQEDVTSTYITNPSFELSAEGTTTSAQALTSGGSYYGWTLPSLGSSYINISIGDATTCNGNAFGVPTATAGSYYYFARRGWNSSSSSDATLSTTMSSLPVGQYVLTMDYKGLDSYDSDHSSQGSYFTVSAVEGETTLNSVTTNAFTAVNGNSAGSGNFTGESNWQSLTLSFAVTTAGDVTLNILHHMVGGVRTDVVIDNLVLTYTETVTATAVTLSSSSLELDYGGSATLTASFTPEGANSGTDITWSTSDETVATVADGVVTAAGPGTATITATTSGGLTATCSVTVTDVTAAAAPANYSEVAAGDFYIVNAATGKFLSGANSWGTQASLVDHGTPFTVALGDGVYTLNSHFQEKTGTNKCYFNGTYVDGNSTNLHITAISDGKYSISTADGSEFVTANANDNIVANTAANANSVLAQWYFVSKDNLETTLTTATSSAPVDATFYIADQNFSRNYLAPVYNQSTQTLTACDTYPWTMDASNYNLKGGNNDNFCAESYHATFTLSQKLTVPNGMYKMRAQAAENATSPVAVVYANDETVAFNAMANGESSMGACSTQFTAGNYYTDWITVNVTDGTLTVGVKSTSSSNWCIWDNFELYYYGLDHSRYNTIKNAALVINPNLDTSTTDAAVEAAITTEEIDAAIVNLRAAFVSSLSRLTVPADPGYIDVTDVMVDNASVSENTDYWTIEGTPNTSYSWAFCDYGECEFYQQNFKFYQTLALGTGTWEFGVTGFHRAGNHSTYFYAGATDKVLIPGVESSEVNSMAAAQTYFDNGNGKVALKFAVEEKTDVEIGINNQDTETDKWTIFRNFTLKYYGEAIDLTQYEEALAAAVEAASVSNIPQAAIEELANVVSENNKEYTTVSDYQTAISNIETATTKAKSLQAPYAAYKTLDSEVQALYDVAKYEELTTGAHNTLGAALNTAKTDIETKTTVDDVNTVYTTLRAAGATYAGAANPTEDAKFNLTFMLTNPDVSSFPAWTSRENVPGWYTEQTDGNSQTMVNDAATSEDGTKTNFFEYWSASAKANNLFTLYQKVTLPVGTYDISCYAFAQDQYAGTNTVGVYFYANDTQGSSVTTTRLTEASLSFVNDTEQEVKIGLKAITGNSYNWMGIGYMELYKVPAQTMALDETETEVLSSGAYTTVTYARTFSAGWNSLVLPFATTKDELGADKVIAFAGTTTEDNLSYTANFTEVTDALSPNVPYMVKYTTVPTELSFSNKTVAPATSPVAVDGTNSAFTFTGTYIAYEKGENSPIVSGDYVIASNGLKAAAGGNALRAFRAYFKNVSGTTAKLNFVIDGQETTGLETIELQKALTGDAIYNLNGQRVNKAQKGVYIVNGKKVIVK
ncbi:MAG: Ig-like domain-containing protein [Prevotella sp.]|nr:Ig-like domain-containing protein [Prevotella sp.]